MPGDEKNPAVCLHPSGVGHTCIGVGCTPGRVGSAIGELRAQVGMVSADRRNGEANCESGR